MPSQILFCRHIKLARASKREVNELYQPRITKGYTHLEGAKFMVYTITNANFLRKSIECQRGQFLGWLTTGKLNAFVPNIGSYSNCCNEACFTSGLIVEKEISPLFWQINLFICNSSSLYFFPICFITTK